MSLWMDPPVRVVILSNVTLSSCPLSQDGVTLALGDRVLLTAQTVAADNGVYDLVSISGGTAQLLRSSDASATGQLVAGTVVRVTEGTSYGKSEWVLTTPNPITLGTTSLTFQMSPVISIPNVNGFNFTPVAVTGSATQLPASTTGVEITSSPSGNTTLNDPPVAPGIPGQILVIANTSTNPVTFQSTNNFNLRDQTHTLNDHDTLTMLWVPPGTWAELISSENPIINWSQFNVKFFGAKGDGVTDDTAAIQAAINAAISAGGGEVFFPQTPSRYRITQQLIVGPKYVNEGDINYDSFPPSWGAPSFSSSGYSAAVNIPLISLKGASGTVIWADFIPGMEWQPSYAYAAGTKVINPANGNAYECMTPGTSGASGGPSGTGSSADGTCSWNYVGTPGLDSWQQNSAYTVNALVQNQGNFYRCTAVSTGTSTSGPSGTGTSITDGTAVWQSVGTYSANLVAWAPSTAYAVDQFLYFPAFGSYWLCTGAGRSGSSFLTVLNQRASTSTSSSPWSLPGSPTLTINNRSIPLTSSMTASDLATAVTGVFGGQNVIAEVQGSAVILSTNNSMTLAGSALSTFGLTAGTYDTIAQSVTTVVDGGATWTRMSLWNNGTAYSSTTPDYVVCNTGVYKCTTSGTSASGPTGTGSSITDNGVTWKYIGTPSSTPWTPNTAYSTGAIVTASGYNYQCVAGGTSGYTTPNGPGTVSDGSLSWMYIGSPGGLETAMLYYSAGGFGTPNSWNGMLDNLIFLGPDQYPVSSAILANWVSGFFCPETRIKATNLSLSRVRRGLVLSSNYGSEIANIELSSGIDGIVAMDANVTAINNIRCDVLQGHGFVIEGCNTKLTDVVFEHCVQEIWYVGGEGAQIARVYAEDDNYIDTHHDFLIRLGDPRNSGLQCFHTALSGFSGVMKGPGALLGMFGGVTCKVMDSRFYQSNANSVLYCDNACAYLPVLDNCSIPLAYYTVYRPELPLLVSMNPGVSPAIPLTLNGVLIGSGGFPGTTAVTTAAGTRGQALIAGSSGVPAFTNLTMSAYQNASFTADTITLAHYNVDPTSGAVAVTLPDSTGHAGLMLSFKLVNSAAHSVTITGAAPGGVQQNIDGAASLTLSTLNQSVTLVAGNANASGDLNWSVV